MALTRTFAWRVALASYASLLALHTSHQLRLDHCLLDGSSLVFRHSVQAEQVHGRNWRWTCDSRRNHYRICPCVRRTTRPLRQGHTGSGQILRRLVRRHLPSDSPRVSRCLASFLSGLLWRLIIVCDVDDLCRRCVHPTSSATIHNSAES
jgi:hypothetical protein